MYKDLDREFGVIHLAGREYRVRYSLNSLRCLEDYKGLGGLLAEDFHKWSIDDVIWLIHAGSCYQRRNYKAVNRRDFEHVRPTVQELGEIIRMEDLPLLRQELMEAIMLALPDPKPDDDQGQTKALHEGHERALYVDVMHIPYSEYMSSTKKELSLRADCYLEVKGLKEPPELVSEYDD